MYSTVGGKTVILIFTTLLGAAFLWAILERKTRQRKMKRMEAKIRELESRLDANRSSSNLTVESKTNPEDA